MKLYVNAYWLHFEMWILLLTLTSCYIIIHIYLLVK